MVAQAPSASAPITVSALAVATTRDLRRRRSPDEFVAIHFRGSEILEVLDARQAHSDVLTRLRARAAATPIVVDRTEPVLEVLRRAGISPLPPLWNVLELAGLLFPDSPQDGLERVARFFGLVRGEPGLEGDARLVVALFTRLLEHLDQLDSTTLQHVNRLAAPLDWPLRHLFAEVERRRARLLLERGTVPAQTFGSWLPSAAATRKRSAVSPKPRPRALDVEQVVGQFAPEGAVAGALPGYEPRAEQAHMAEAIAHALNDGGRLLVEAGTGTGKSLAYLLPAAALALQNEWRVVVSTATTTLQDQLFGKDLPVVHASLGSDQPLRVTVLKGRANYLCLRRWQTLLQATDLESPERTLLIKTLFWLPRTRTGDRAELSLSPREEDPWQRISAVAEACTPARCDYHRVGVCFLARARRAAEESHIIIANHALLLTDLVNRTRVLPDYQVLIVDEAHHLEDEATAQLGWRIGERELATRLELLCGSSSGARGTVGALPEALGHLRGAGEAGAKRAAQIAAEVEGVERTIVQLRRDFRTLFEHLGSLAGEDGVASEDDTATLRVTSGTRAGSLWQEIESLWADASRRLQSLVRVAADLQDRLDGVPDGSEEVREVAAELAAQVEFWHTLRERLDSAIHTPDPSTVYWVSTSRQGWTWLNTAPLEVAGVLAHQLFAEPHAVALVSATLAVAGSFDYVKNRLGLPDADSLALDAPFDYRRAALLYVPYDVPDPTQPGYQPVVEQVLVDTIARVGGRTLVLFTSRAHLRATYVAVRERLAAQGIMLLGQGIDDASRTRLLEAFRRGSGVALFGTSSFWEGVDVVGEALSCVVLARLPFAVPTDPVYAARAEQFEDPFSQYAVPQAVLRFKQGFGRLIRSHADRGAVVVLDRRITTRNYGAVFLRSLPECTAKQGPASRTGQAVADWLAAG
jgi:predicted DnaQ family exonuclease/DinG family helicase